jgi:hypothetical protein
MNVSPRSQLWISERYAGRSCGSPSGMRKRYLNTPLSSVRVDGWGAFNSMNA